jgi:hypothetical protein
MQKGDFASRGWQKLIETLLTGLMQASARRSVLHALVGLVVAKLLLISYEITAHPLATQVPNFTFERQDILQEGFRALVHPTHPALPPAGFVVRTSFR